LPVNDSGKTRYNEYMKNEMPEVRRGHINTINAVRIIMSTDTGSAVSKQKLQDLKNRMLALKEHL
jgi:hypothetical protein